MTSINGYTFQPMDEASVQQIWQWRYPAPYDIYNATDLESTLECFLDPSYHYYSLWQSGELIGFRCFGKDAQVRGGDYSAAALDLGGGLRPDLTGQGLGAHVMQAAFEFAQLKFAPTAFRCTVAAFNVRAQTVCQRVGYEERSRFQHPLTDKEFIVFWKSLAT